MTETLFVSCIFGKNLAHLYRAFAHYRCVLFSNNPSMEPEAKRKGWEFVLVSKFPLSDDFRESSLQAKYTKFLQFLDDYPDFKRYQTILYFDHKNRFSEQEAERLMALMKPEKTIFMMSSREGWSVRDEMKLSSAELRYRESMPATEKWIQGLVDAGEASWDGQIYATSFIIYRQYEAMLPFLKSLYDTLWELKQPQCQTVWGAMSQIHRDKIQSIHWTQTSMYRQTPLPPLAHFLRQSRYNLRKIVKGFFSLLGLDYESFRRKVILRLLPASKT